jgi:hypothetical protein
MFGRELEITHRMMSGRIPKLGTLENQHAIASSEILNTIKDIGIDFQFLTYFYFYNDSSLFWIPIKNSRFIMQGSTDEHHSQRHWLQPYWAGTQLHCYI